MGVLFKPSIVIWKDILNVAFKLTLKSRLNGHGHTHIIMV